MEKRLRVGSVSHIGDELFYLTRLRFLKIILISQISFLVQFSSGKPSNTCVYQSKRRIVRPTRV